MRILCFGDSNTWGYKPDNTGRYSREERWPTVMADFLGDEYSIVEEGLCGRTTDSPKFIGTTSSGASGYSALSKIVRKYYPFDMMTIMLGANDLRPDINASTKQTADNIAYLVKKVLNYEYTDGGKIPLVLVISPAHIKECVSKSPSAYMFGLKEDAVQKSKEFSEHYKQIAQELGVLFFDAAEHTEVSDEDGLHLDAKGHYKLARSLAKFIKSL